MISEQVIKNPQKEEINENVCMNDTLQKFVSPLQQQDQLANHQEVKDVRKTISTTRDKEQLENDEENQLNHNRNHKFRLFSCLASVCKLFNYRKSSLKKLKSVSDPHQIKTNDKNAEENVIEKYQIPKELFSIQLKAQRSFIKVKNKTDIPAVLSLKTGAYQEQSNVDIICVIDTSGSMQGSKLNYAKIAMKQLKRGLKKGDRLGIVSFSDLATLHCSLIEILQNQQKINRIIDSLESNGGTNIYSGIKQALQIIAKNINPDKVTSIFLLSDGQNNENLEIIKSNIQNFEKQQVHALKYTINTFGFGEDHDEDLMSGLSRYKNGNFYYINELSKLDQVFYICLGSLLSVCARQIIIEVRVTEEGKNQGISIKKTFQNQWKKVKTNNYKIKLEQMSSEFRRDYVFQLEIPYIQAKLEDSSREKTIVQAFYTLKTMKKQIITGECSLNFTFLGKNQRIQSTVQNPQVIENWLRARAIQKMQQSLQKIDKQNHKDAQKDIDAMLEQIKSNRKVRKTKMTNLISDLQAIKLKYSKQKWSNNQRKVFVDCSQKYINQTCTLNTKQIEMSVDVLKSKIRKP